MTAYYNENDPKAAAWLRELIKQNLIAPGDVDERSIKDVEALDLLGYTQCHFFAGIGGWSYALRFAGWPDYRPVWTGSCPCQPFSAAGKGEGHNDPRHLWPEWFRLIGECRPVAIFGEQVSAAIRHGWLDLVSADLEGLDYTIGAAVMGAHSVGAPHIRQRLYFVAHTEHRRQAIEEQGAQFGRHGGEAVFGLAHADGRDASAEGLQRGGEHGQQQEDGGVGFVVGDTEQPGFQEQRGERGTPRLQNGADPRQAAQRTGAPVESMGDTDESRRARFGGGRQNRTAESSKTHLWSDCDWLPCIDGKARPVEPGTFPLAHGATARVGRLRGYGNAIVPQVAAEFIGAYLELDS